MRESLIGDAKYSMLGTPQCCVKCSQQILLPSEVRRNPFHKSQVPRAIFMFVCVAVGLLGFDTGKDVICWSIRKGLSTKVLSLNLYYTFCNMAWSYEIITAISTWTSKICQWGSDCYNYGYKIQVRVQKTDKSSCFSEFCWQINGACPRVLFCFLLL